MKSKLEKIVEERKESKWVDAKDLAKAFTKSYLYGLGIGLDPIGMFAPYEAREEPKSVADVFAARAIRDKDQKGGSVYVAITELIGLTYGAATSMIFVGSATGGISWIVTGLMDSTYGVYRYAKEAVQEKRDSYTKNRC